MGDGMRSERGLPTSIFAADFSPDGKTLITASLGGVLAEWDGETGRERHVFLVPEENGDRRAPRTAVAAGGRKAERRVRFDRPSRLVRGSSLLSARFSRDGALFAVGAANGTVVLWKAEGRADLLGWRAHDRDVVALDISPDGRWLGTGALEEVGTTFRVWSLPGGPGEVREVLSDHRHVGGVWAVCFSPDSRVVAAGGRTLSGYTAPQLYEVESGKSPGWLHWDMTRAMSFSPDGDRLLTGDEFGNVKLWKIAEHYPAYEHAAHPDPVLTVGFSQDGKFHFSGALGGSLRVWETATGRLIREHSLEGRTLACRFGADGRVLHAASAAPGSARPEIRHLS